MPQAFQGWYKHDIDAWQGSAAVQDMTDAEYRAFHNLIQAQFQQEDGMLPADEKMLARLSRKRAEWPTVREAVLEQFVTHENGRIYNPRQYREWSDAVELSAKRSRAAAATNRKRYPQSAESVAERSLSDEGSVAERPLSEPTSDAERSVNTLRNGTLRKEETIAQSEPARVRKPSSDEVALVYRTYPRQVGRAKALDAIGRAVTRLCAGGALPAMDTPEALAYLRERAAAFSRAPAGNAGDYTPHPATWFNQERYFDDDKEWQRGSGGADRGGNGNGSGSGGPAAQRVADNRAKFASAVSGRGGEGRSSSAGRPDASELFGAGAGGWSGRTVDAAMVGNSA